VRPLRFRAADYVARPDRALAGAPVVASWDAALAPSMLAGGSVLEEEAVAEGLLQDLAGEAP
jgi:hypothetical protein